MPFKKMSHRLIFFYMDKDRVAKVKVVSPTPTVVLLIILHEHGRLKKNIVEPTS